MLKAENDRFKAALEVIAAMTEPPYISAPGIAKAALNWGDEMRHTKERGYTVTLTDREYDALKNRAIVLEAALRVSMINPLYMQYLGACALLGRVSKWVKDPDELDCIRQALCDCAKETDGRFEVIRTSGGWSIEPATQDRGTEP